MMWTVQLQGGPTRVNHAAAIIGINIYCFGGYCSKEEYNDWDPIPVHVLNTKTLRWSPVEYAKNEITPFQRYGHSAIAYGHLVYMWGGRNNSVACETLCCFNTETLFWSTPRVDGMVPNAKDGHSACLIKNKMFIFGGFEYVTDRLSAEIHCLDLDTLHWSLVNATGPVPSPRDFHTAVNVGQKMYVFGGRSDLSRVNINDQLVYCAQLYCLDTARDHWVHIEVPGTLPEGRRSHSAWYYEGGLYVFGGYNSINRKHYNNLYKYSIEENKWTSLSLPGQWPCKRRRQVCLKLNDKVFLFGGTTPVDREQADPEEELVDKSDLHILDYKCSLRTLSIMKCIEHNLMEDWLPGELKMDIKIMSMPNHISKVANPSQTG